MSTLLGLALKQVSQRSRRCCALTALCVSSATRLNEASIVACSLLAAAAVVQH